MNAGRGRVVDTDALFDELESGRLRAVLDVVDPSGSRMTIPCGTPGLAVTPHIAGGQPRSA